MLNRAYSLLTIKSVDPETRTITGLATSPTPDRIGDVVEPLGVKFKNPLPLLLFHDHRRPVGTVKFDKPTKDGITFTAKMVDPADVESESLKDRIREAWDSVKTKIVRGVSIGFRAMQDGVEMIRDEDGGISGFKFTKTEVLELSLVTVPANADATIHTIKSIDAEHLARVAPTAVGTPSTTPAVAGTHARKRGSPTMKTTAEKIQAFKAEKDAKVQRMNALMASDGDDVVTLDAEQQAEFDELERAVDAIDNQLARLDKLDKMNQSMAAPVAGHTPTAAAASRDITRVHVRQTLPPGIGFARLAMAKAVAHMDHRYVGDVAKRMFPHDDRLHAHLDAIEKATVTAGNTQNSLWAGSLVDPTNLVSEFIEYLTPQTIIGKLGTNGIPGPTRVPFNVRVNRQTALGEAYWVGEGAPKPVHADEFDAITLLWAKVATIRVITQELARFSTPNAETLVRNGLTRAIARRLDIDFIDPAQAAVANVNPASITNGLTPLSSAGTSADNARTDIGNILEQYIANNVDPSTLVLIMPNTLALALSLMRNDLGNKEFPDLTMNGGFLEGIPVITSQYAANASGAGNLVIALNAEDLLLADDGRVDIDISTEASLQMLDNPTNDSRTGTATQMVSLWQTNSIGLRAERFINWVKARSGAVVYMDDVNWGSIGSPA